MTGLVGFVGLLAIFYGLRAAGWWGALTAFVTTVAAASGLAVATTAEAGGASFGKRRAGQRIGGAVAGMASLIGGLHGGWQFGWAWAIGGYALGAFVGLVYYSLAPHRPELEIREHLAHILEMMENVAGSYEFTVSRFRHHNLTMAAYYVTAPGSRELHVSHLAKAMHDGPLKSPELEEFVAQSIGLTLFGYRALSEDDRATYNSTVVEALARARAA